MKTIILKYLETKSNRMFLYASIWAIIAAFVTFFVEPKMKLLFLAAIGYSIKGFFMLFVESYKLRRSVKVIDKDN